MFLDYKNIIVNVCASKLSLAAEEDKTVVTK